MVGSGRGGGALEVIATVFFMFGGGIGGWGGSGWRGASGRAGRIASRAAGVISVGGRTFLVDLPIDQKIVEDSGWAPDPAVRPAFDSSLGLVEDVDGPRADGAPLAFVQPARDHGEVAEIAAAEDDARIMGAADVAAVSRFCRALIVFNVRSLLLLAV